jgi:hypothetical protein
LMESGLDYTLDIGIRLHLYSMYKYSYL